MIIKYIIEDKIINIVNNETNVYYTGKDGYVHSGATDVEGYISYVDALKKLEREVNNSYLKKLDNNHALEGDRWLHIYTIRRQYIFEKNNGY